MSKIQLAKKSNFPFIIPNQSPKRKDQVTRRNRRNAKSATKEDVSMNFKRYIYNVSKKVYPQLGITSEAMSIMNSYCVDMFERIAGESARLMHYSGKRTLTEQDIKAAIKLEIPRGLAGHAIHRGDKALRSYKASMERD